MSKYELTIVLDGKATKAQKTAKQDFVKKLVKLHKGEVKAENDWGVRDLAFKIENSSTGAFLYFELELDPSSVTEISEKTKLEDGIIRYLLVKSE